MVLLRSAIAAVQTESFKDGYDGLRRNRNGRACARSNCQFQFNRGPAQQLATFTIFGTSRSPSFRKSTQTPMPWIPARAVAVRTSTANRNRTVQPVQHTDPAGPDVVLTESQPQCRSDDIPDGSADPDVPLWRSGEFRRCLRKFSPFLPDGYAIIENLNNGGSPSAKHGAASERTDPGASGGSATGRR